MLKVKATTFTNSIGQVIDAGDTVVLVGTGKYDKKGYRGTFRGLVGSGASIFIDFNRDYNFLHDGRRLTPKLMERLGGPIRPSVKPYDWTKWKEYWLACSAWKDIHTSIRSIPVQSSRFSASKLIFKIAEEKVS